MVRFPIFGGDPARRIAEADSVAVIGLGRFGSSLAIELMAGGTEVLGIDLDEELVQAHNGELTQVVRADSTKEEALRQLAIDEFDRVVVAIGGDVSASILTCSVLLSMKIPVIWAKAVDDRHGLILEQLGIQHVIYPEKDMGRRVAHLVRGAALDYIEVAPGYALVKTAAPSVLHGKRLGDTGIRASHGITIAAFQHGDEAWRNADNATVLHEGDTILVVGPTANAEAFAQLR
ncbi:TrkA family potassium uptake protein [Agromyces sp. H3Y2-19a]|uniref:potassium channel family protein n=1 Tax=Agromyces TaxID=33877 RepID=UPI001E545136|nr:MULTISPECIES: TrkA family potassium uptake protein [Agromyces]MCD5345528.1 TrkA family potassium uptake protein [Agromyces sp. S2-1-8]MDF0515469.1 TrkA family potassium uptake protein [Agromyces chromiiresistens]